MSQILPLVIREIKRVGSEAINYKEITHERKF